MFALRCGLKLLLLAVVCGGPLPLWLHHAIEHDHAALLQPSPQAHCCHAHPEHDHNPSDVPSWHGEIQDCSVCFQLAQASLGASPLPAVLATGMRPEYRRPQHFASLTNELGSHPPRGPPAAS